MADQPDHEKKSPFEQIKAGLEELLDAAKKGEPLSKRFRTSQLRVIKDADGREIVSRVTSDPATGGGSFE